MGGSNLITFEKKLVLNNDPEKSYLKSSFWREIQNLNFLYGTTNFARSPKLVLKCYFIPTLTFPVEEDPLKVNFCLKAYLADFSFKMYFPNAF